MKERERDKKYNILKESECEKKQQPVGREREKKNHWKREGEKKPTEREKERTKAY